MSRDIFINKWVIGGIGFLIALGIACYIWYQHELAPYKQRAAELDKIIQQSERKRNVEAANGAESAADAPVESTTQTTEKPRTEATQYVPGDVFIGPTPPPIPKSQDELVSPYGFGPYPELPEGFGPITWPRKDAESELMIRVRIKLLNEGVPVEGIVMSNNGLVYPIIKGICYVTWGETSDGLRYLRRTRGHPDDDVRTIADEKEAQGETLTQADVPHIKLVPMEEGGIDPYTFLDLPK